LIHFGNPNNFEKISHAEFNKWQKKKKHPLIPLCPYFPQSIIACRFYIAPPDMNKEDLLRSDFENSQFDFTLKIRGLDKQFPKSKTGNHGYDLVISSGMWDDKKWKGPSIIIPIIDKNDKPNKGRR
jgi:hypothetical protein